MGASFFSEKNFRIDVSGALARIYNSKNFFNSPDYFVERCIPSIQNAQSNMTRGTGQSVKWFFMEVLRMAKKKAAKKKATKKKATKKKKK